MVSIAVAGAAGRMGIRIIHAVSRNSGARLTGAFEAAGHPAVGKTVAAVSGLPDAPGVVGDDPVEVFAEADVLIDFTAPQASLKNLKVCSSMGKAMVIGTTGLNEAEKNTLAGLAVDVPVVYAPNMSVGMNYMFKLVGEMTRVLGEDYALEVVEAHHDQKKDAPSGSAERLIEALCLERGWVPAEVCRHGRVGQVGARTREEIGVSVIRGGDIVGDHTVYFIGQGERLELTHRAHSRDTFASGAVRAALWVKGKEPGVYDMQDVLGLK
ncbi:MAG: 4-hydroxy-tetrahydrodipicolinate reductase [Deltaproteobacteria bacterium]|nr:4-hydroxy-tetrahydrodipicolinate reductase [Deltaproteobacteria bacterium]